MLTKALVLVSLCLVLSQVQAQTCTGVQSIGTSLVSGADSCFTVSTTTVDISTGTTSFADIPVPMFDSTKGTLKGIHITFGSVTWAPTATYSVSSDTTNFAVLLQATATNSYITMTSSVDNSIIADSSASGYELDTSSGRFTNSAGNIMGGILQGLNDRTMLVRDNTYLSSTLTAAAGVQTFTVTPQTNDAKFFTVRGLASTSVPNDVLVADASVSAIPAGYSSVGGSGTWNLVCQSNYFFGNQGGGGAITITMVPHLNAQFTVQYDYLAPSVQGDPQIVGFQGQHYQVHGTPDEHYNLISSPNYFVNSKFVYMANGICNYNDTECFSHPGTYIGEIALVAGANHVKVTSGPHSTGLSVYINDKLAPVGTRVRFNNDTNVHVVSHNRAVITTADFSLSTVNSDLFLNLGVDFTNAAVLHAGHTKVTIPGSATPAAADKLISTAYPEFAMHGLLGQTWRNIVWPHNRVYQGEPADYLVSNLFSPEFLYSEYQA